MSPDVRMRSLGSDNCRYVNTFETRLPEIVVIGHGARFFRERPLRVGPDAQHVGAAAFLGRGKLGGQRPVRVGAHPVELDGQHLNSLRFGRRRCVPGRVASLRRLGLFLDDVGAVHRSFGFEPGNVGAVSMIGPFLLRPASGTGPSVEAYTVAASTIGLAIVVAGKIALGRSFGLLPANRGVVSSGAHRLVRHPTYLGYVLTHGSFLAANPSWWNVVALGAADTALLLRAFYEEGTLLHDPVYARYRQRVRWRLVPGVF